MKNKNPPAGAAGTEKGAGQGKERLNEINKINKVNKINPDKSQAPR